MDLLMNFDILTYQMLYDIDGHINTSYLLVV